jgi:SAM-dependent methyltransferase
MTHALSPGALFDELLDDRPARGTATLRHDDGRRTPLPLSRWLGPPCPVDAAIADAAAGPVLDVGCGPGRLLDALARRGTFAVGVDLSPVAVRLARSRGRRAMLGSVFDQLPGGWGTALLLDGNVGIGGDAAALLRRVGGLLAAGGAAIVEVDRPGAGTRAGRVRLEAGERASRWFAWAHVDATGIASVAREAGLEVQRIARLEDRWFTWLV